MLVVLILTQIALILKLIAVILNEYYITSKVKETYGNFDAVMSIILVSIYAFTTLVYIPLFSLIICKMKKDYSDLYNEIHCKFILIIGFSIFFLIVRFVIYIDMKFWEIVVFDYNITSVGDIIFYISEILMSLVISYVLFTISKLDMDANSPEKGSISPKQLSMQIRLSKDFSLRESDATEIKIEHCQWLKDSLMENDNSNMLRIVN